MNAFSLFNDVLGPVMHGPSSSHTAAGLRIGAAARDLLGDEPASAVISFDPQGSYGRVYADQGSDLAFAAGIMGWDMTDDRFSQALEHAAAHGPQIAFRQAPIPWDDHPNAVTLDLGSKSGRKLSVSARSVGGGAIEIVRIDNLEVLSTGRAHDLFVLVEPRAAEEVRTRLAERTDLLSKPNRFDSAHSGPVMIQAGLSAAPDASDLDSLRIQPGVMKLLTLAPLFFPARGGPLFSSGREMADLAETRGWTLGRAALEYEAALLGLPLEEIILEMERRYSIMESSVRLGLENPEQASGMKLLSPTADKVFRAEAEKRLALGGPQTRAAARALAVMHVNGSMGLVCAAPTGGSAGALPGVLTTLAEDLGFERDRVIKAMFAAGGVGLVFLMSGRTFAAETAGCQVEIGAAGAMAAAAVIEAAGGSAGQALDAAAIALQNTMGSVCDLVRGRVEIPCHTRNAAAAASAFVCADLILGGYENPISFDDSAAASLEVGRALKPEYRCTAKGGLAITPSALALKPRA